jgi:cysteine-rich repeat protein
MLCIVVCSCAFRLCVCSMWEQSEFWKNAKLTADLTALRQSELPPLPQKPIPKKITDPNFFPLCGNGRIDTKADYERLQREGRLHPMTFTKRMLSLIADTDSDNMDALHSLVFMADEVCDDGNREDLDGCSGDCLSLDVWTSSCEIAMDRKLKYEVLIAVPGTGHMIASASDGIYALSKIMPGQRIQTSMLICSKDFEVTNIWLLSSTDIALYSSKKRMIYKFEGMKKTITPARDLTKVVNASNNEIEFLGDGGLIIRDDHTIVLLDSVIGDIVSKCTFTQLLDESCFYISTTRNEVKLRCDSIRVVFVVTPSLCSTEDGAKNWLETENIWRDVMNAVNDYVLKDTPQSVQGFYSFVDPPLKTSPTVNSTKTPVVLRGYLAMGLVFEIMYDSPRLLLDPNLMNYFRGAGDETVISWLMSRSPSCGPEPCIFDLPLGYNPLSSTTFSGASRKTFFHVLEELVSDELKLNPNITTLYDLRTEGKMYLRVIYKFVLFLREYSKAHSFKKRITHPETNNLWMFQGDSLYEISRSGVQARFADGTCLPSNIAICPPYFWANGGSACRPCVIKDEASPAWKSVCDGYCLSNTCYGIQGTQGSRRLLATRQSGWVMFIVKGDQTLLTKTWPNATLSSWGGNETAVTLKSDDIEATAASLNKTLANMTTKLSILIPPFGLGGDQSVGDIVFTVVKNSNHTDVLAKIRELWPHASIENADRYITITVPTSNDPQQDMRSVKLKLAENNDLHVVVNPYLKVMVSNPPETPDDILFTVNCSNVATLRIIWPTALFVAVDNSTIKVTIPSTGNVSNDLHYARRGFVNSTGFTVITSPYRRGVPYTGGTTQPPTTTPKPAPIAYATLASLEINRTVKITATLLAELVTNVTNSLCTPGAYAFCNVSVLSVSIGNRTTYCAKSVCLGIARRRLLQTKVEGGNVNMGIVTSNPIPAPERRIEASSSVVTGTNYSANAPVFNRQELDDAEKLIKLVQEKFTDFFRKEEGEESIETWKIGVVCAGILLIIGSVWALKSRCCFKNGKQLSSKADFSPQLPYTRILIADTATKRFKE